MWTGGVAGWSYFYSNTTMDWRSARQWCRNHYTDMVAIQNQQEIEHLNSWLPRQPTYYWIGIRKVDDVWTWVGTNKSLTDQATNWATGEPNNKGQVNGINEDCVEMYIKRESQAGKWNDEKCVKSKTALCYAAACKNDSCDHGECVETINSHKCQCNEGFYGDKCEHVVHCEELSRPGHGTFECQHPLGDWSFVSFCVFSCEEGYDMPQSRSDTLLCGASGHWNDSVPICAAVQCSPPVAPESGQINCQPPLSVTASPSSYPQGSACTFTCNEGYEHQGPLTTECTQSGQWSSPPPTCTVVHCEELSRPGHGTLECQHPLGDWSFVSFCVFSCEEGYDMPQSRSDTLLCGTSGHWNDSVPICAAVQCSPPVAPESGQINCQPPLSVTASPSSYPQGSACTFTCNEGYEHQGPLTTECTQSGQWSSPLPTCTAMGCPVLNAPVDGALNCTDSDQTHASQCSFACNQGFTLRGHRVVTCGLHGNWTAETPVCQAVQCPVLPETDNMAVRCEGDTGGRFSYGSSCTFTCSRGYSLRGAHTTTCTATAAWSDAVPICEPVQCSPPVAPESGQINCQPPLSVTASPSSYPQGSACTFTCNEGYEHQGPLTTECTQSGQWSSPLPTCTAMGCPVLNAPVDGALNCTDSDQTHASQCSFACNQGFTLRGHRVITCGLHGNWTAETPVCQAVPPSSHTEVVLAAGGAVSLSALSLAVWLMKRLRKLTARKFSLTSNSDAEDPSQYYKNSIDGLI
ncbi:unnamed protein product [Merluccius merluccius]